jgi:hypothetical protein
LIARVASVQNFEPNRMWRGGMYLTLIFSMARQ